MEIVKAWELRLGDVVQLFEGPYGTATVKQIKDGLIYFFRPHVVIGDFTYSGGVPVSIGIEEFSRPVSDPAPFALWQRGKVNL